jgi:hypothetical protein
MVPMEASIPAKIKGAVNDKLVYCDLASLRRALLPATVVRLGSYSTTDQRWRSGW